MALIAISTVTDPVTPGSTVTVTGTADPSVVNVYLTLRDAQGNVVTTSTFGGTTWTESGIDISSLNAGPIALMVVGKDSGAAIVDVALATTVKQSTLRHATATPWATSLDVRQNFNDLAIASVDMDEACWIASDILFSLTGSRWPGTVHEDKLRPQARWRQYDRPQWWQTANWMPLRARTFSRYGWCSCNRGRDWGCQTIPEIQLPHYPVHKGSIVVMIDGNQFDGWDLRDDCWLQRTDMSGWPCCQKTQLPDTEDGTWSVSFDWGLGPESGGVQAAAMLGYHLALAYYGRPECKLPERVQHLTRGGTSIALLDPLTLLKEGLTGLGPVDMWVASKMLGASRRAGTVSVPGKLPRYRKEN